MKGYNELGYCPKCESEEAKTSWMPGVKFFGFIIYAEKMRRDCYNCGYTWDELPADAE